MVLRIGSNTTVLSRFGDVKSNPVSNLMVSKIDSCTWTPHVLYIYVFCKVYVGFARRKVPTGESRDGFTLPKCKYFVPFDLIWSAVCT